MDWILRTREKKDVQRLCYRGMVLFLFVCMGWVVYKSIYKISANNTGTETTYKNLNSAVNLSVTVCKSYYEDKSGRIEPLRSVLSLGSDGNWTQLHNESFPTKNAFLWYREKRLLCKSIPAVGDEIKIVHYYYKGLSKNMFIFLHETGFFAPEFDMEMTNYLTENTILNLELNRVEKIPDSSTCTNTRLFDDCKLDYIAEALFQSVGCIMQFSRFL